MTPAALLDRLARIGYLPQRWPELVVPEGLQLLRLVEQHRSGCLLHDGERVIEAKLLPKMRHARAGKDASDRPCVGDWVLAAQRGDEWIVERQLPRFSLLRRGAAGEGHARQAIAANVDLVLIVCGLDGDYNPRRIERYLALVSASGAQPLVVLTKADRCAEAAARHEQILELVAPLPVYLVNAKSAESCAGLAAHLQAGVTAVLVGSSGAGKSTLTNTLLGSQVQATAEVRECDQRGRHTTVTRALKRLPGGACLIDTPGLREIKLTGEEDLGEAGFAEIEALAADCRFRDCQHQAEPGCAVRAAIDDGRLDPGRLNNWSKLGREIQLAQGSALDRQQQKRLDASASRAMRAAGRRKR